MMIPVYSVVAYSNTGKTTLLEKLIPELGRRGYRTAVIKHDAHEFEIDREGKDSWRLTKAGAAVTVVASRTKAAIMENRFVPIEELIARIKDVDIILTEGYKHGPWPKIALCRSDNAKPFPLPPEDCLAVMSDLAGTALPETAGANSIGLNDVEKLADIIEEDLKTRNNDFIDFNGEMI
jgi:molybdopterin-guanine dinucleotide biosynthesis protein MobB